MPRDSLRLSLYDCLKSDPRPRVMPRRSSRRAFAPCFLRVDERFLETRRAILTTREKEFATYMTDPEVRS